MSKPFELSEDLRKLLHPEVASFIEGYVDCAPDVESGDEDPEELAGHLVGLFLLQATFQQEQS